MAHELSFTNGRANVLSVRETPWHKEGVVLKDAPTLADALRLAGLDYKVEKRPTFRAIETGIAGLVEYKQNDDAWITFRPDTGAELGAVGSIYTPIQNYDAYRALEPMLDNGVLTIETAGVLRDGADAWIQCKFNVEKLTDAARAEFERDEVIPMALITTNHTGRRNATISLVTTRVVCANTLGMAEQQMDGRPVRKIEIRHTGDAPAKIVEAARDLFGRCIENFNVMAQQYDALRARVIGEDVFRELVIDTIAKDPRQNPNFNPDAKLAEMVVNRYERKKTEVTRLWTEGDGHVGDHSAWEALNGAVQALDHNNDLFPTRAALVSHRVAPRWHARRHQAARPRAPRQPRAPGSVSDGRISAIGRGIGAPWRHATARAGARAGQVGQRRHRSWKSPRTHERRTRRGARGARRASRCKARALLGSIAGGLLGRSARVSTDGQPSIREGNESSLRGRIPGMRSGRADQGRGRYVDRGLRQCWTPTH
jgi:phage/plasmid-like protein (TIGR03299 family)